MKRTAPDSWQGAGAPPPQPSGEVNNTNHNTVVRARSALKDTTNMANFFKLAVSKGLASAIIGSGGDRIKSIMQAHDCFLKLSKRASLFPKTQNQVLLIGAPNNEKLIGCIKAITDEFKKILPEPQDTVEIDLSVIVPMEVTARAADFESLKEKGVTMKTDPATHNLGSGATDRMVTFNGQIAAVVESVLFANEQVQKYKNETWYVTWGTTWVLEISDENPHGMHKPASSAVPIANDHQSTSGVQWPFQSPELDQLVMLVQQVHFSQ